MGRTSMYFAVAACNDAHILFMQDENDKYNNVYELVIGKYSHLEVSKVKFACAKFTRVCNLQTCKYTPGMYFCACERKYIQELIYIRVN